MRTLINLVSKINAMTSEYASKLDLKVRLNYVEAQKNDSFTFKMLKIVQVSLLVNNKLC